MALSEEDDPFYTRPRPKPTRHEIGQQLESLSVDELDARIELLKHEIARLEQMRASKTASLQAADSFFKR